MARPVVVPCGLGIAYGLHDGTGLYHLFLDVGLALRGAPHSGEVTHGIPEIDAFLG